MARLFVIVYFISILSLLAVLSVDATSASSSSASASSSTDGAESSSSSSISSITPVDCSGDKKPAKCKANQVYSNCTQSLGRRLKCSQQGKPVPDTKKPKKCKSGCVCQPGYLKTAKGKCVPETQCYGNLVCKDSEVVNTCPKNRINDFCPTSNKNAEASSSNDQNKKCGKPVCTCRFNYKRDPKSRKCIPTRECPPFDCNSPKEEYNACPPACPSDSCSQATPTGRCPVIGRIGIVVECKPACRCVKDYWRDNNTCVPYLACPGKCPTNERYSSCVQGECRALNCTQKNQPIACPDNQAIGSDLVKGSCQGGCVCVEGTLRNATGSCVPEDKCPVVCPANEVFSNCIQAECRELNCSQRGQPLNCSSAESSEEASKSCQSGCICQYGYLRTAKGICVPENQCYGGLVCKNTEVVDTCPNYSFGDYCPTCEKDAQLSSKVVSEPCAKVPECTCRFNYKRLQNGTCVPARNCPAFNCSGLNQEYNSCPPICPSDDCSQATPTGKCPLPGRIGIILQCRPSCRCIPGYWKDKGVCVPYLACPEKCPSNEVFSSCAQSICRAEDCKDKGVPVACVDIDEKDCERRCVCAKGTLRNSDGKCVPEDKCPAPKCGENEALVECPNACAPIYCPKSYKEEQARVAGCASIALCRPSECRCLPDYRRDSTGKCIYIGKCPGICPKNEEFSNCTKTCGRAQNCSQLQGGSSDVADGPCESGCICKKGMLRDDYEKCVPEDICPGIEV